MLEADSESSSSLGGDLGAGLDDNLAEPLDERCFALDEFAAVVLDDSDTAARSRCKRFGSFGVSVDMSAVALLFLVVGAMFDSSESEKLSVTLLETSCIKSQ